MTGTVTSRLGSSSALQIHPRRSRAHALMPGNVTKLFPVVLPTVRWRVFCVNLFSEAVVLAPHYCSQDAAEAVCIYVLQLMEEALGDIMCHC